jgi:hypothetical protein
VRGPCPIHHPTRLNSVVVCLSLGLLPNANPSRSVVVCPKLNSKMFFDSAQTFTCVRDYMYRKTIVKFGWIVESEEKISMLFGFAHFSRFTRPITESTPKRGQSHAVVIGFRRTNPIAHGNWERRQSMST